MTSLARGERGRKVVGLRNFGRSHRQTALRPSAGQVTCVYTGQSRITESIAYKTHFLSPQEEQHVSLLDAVQRSAMDPAPTSHSILSNPHG